MSKLKVDTETGELLPIEIMVESDKAPAIVLDVSEVSDYHNNPKGLADKIRAQAGFMVFDIESQKGRDACRSHAANIIRCIAPAAKASQALAETAKQVVKQDLNFRKVFEEEVREIAAFHRRPLTEYEEEEKRKKEAERIAEEARQAKEKYLKDWQEAIDYDELFTLRREKELREAEEAARILAEDIAAKKAWAKEFADGYQFLFADIGQLVSMPFDEFKSVVTARVETHKAAESAKLEAERERIRLEEEAKARREAEAKVRAEQAENERIEREAKQAADRADSERLEREHYEMIKQSEAQDERKMSETNRFTNSVYVSPGRDALIQMVASRSFVIYEVAELWLINEFGKEVKSMIDQDEVTPEQLRASAKRIRESAARAPSMSEQRQEQELADRLDAQALQIERRR